MTREQILTSLASAFAGESAKAARHIAKGLGDPAVSESDDEWSQDELRIVRSYQRWEDIPACKLKGTIILLHCDSSLLPFFLAAHIKGALVEPDELDAAWLVLIEKLAARSEMPEFQQFSILSQEQLRVVREFVKYVLEHEGDSWGNHVEKLRSGWGLDRV